MIDSIIKNPVFGLSLTLLIYIFANCLYKKFKSPFLNPLLVSSIVIIIILMIFKIKYEDYFLGGKYLTFLIAPSTVALMLNLYKNMDLLKKNLMPIIVGITAGAIVSIISVLVLVKVFNLNDVMKFSLVPKSLTTAIGVSLSEEFGGRAAITVFSIIVTGVSGAVMAPFVFKLIKIDDSISKGVALGTSAHAMGTTKALEMGEIEGAMSGLSIAISGIVSVILIPIILSFV